MIGDLSSAPEPVVIKLFSQDPLILNRWAPQVGGAIKKIPGVVDVLNSLKSDNVKGQGQAVLPAKT